MLQDDDAQAAERRAQQRLAQQHDLVRRLLAVREQLAGSVFERWSVCNKPGCACAEGRRHGPYYVLATGSGAGRAWRRLDASTLAEARQLVRRSREFQQGLTRLMALQRALAEFLRRHGRVAAARGARRFKAGARNRRAAT